jgi:hypothetical protein
MGSGKWREPGASRSAPAVAAARSGHVRPLRPLPSSPRADARKAASNLPAPGFRSGSGTPMAWREEGSRRVGGEGTTSLLTGGGFFRFLEGFFEFLDGGHEGFDGFAQLLLVAGGGGDGGAGFFRLGAH